MKKLFISLLALLFLTTCIKDAPLEKEETHSDASQSEPQNKDEIIAVEVMFDLFTNTYEGIEIKEIELKSKQNKWVYQFEGILDSQEIEVTYDALTQDILYKDMEHESKKHTFLLKEDLVNIKALLEETKQDVGDDYTLEKWELKKENNLTIFEVEYENKQGHDIEYKYNASTMALIEKR